MIGENTDKDRETHCAHLEDIHVLLKEFIVSKRKNIDIEKVATGEYWYGKSALALNLVDQIMTSDEYILSMRDKFSIVRVKYKPSTTFADKISKVSSKLSKKVFNDLSQKNHDDSIFK